MRDDYNITNVNPRDAMIFVESKQPHYIEHFKQVDGGIRWDLEHKTVASVRYVAGSVAADFYEAKDALRAAIRDDGGTA